MTTRKTLEETALEAGFDPRYFGRNWIVQDALYWWALPAIPGVYVFSAGSRALYVGQTGNLRRRIKSYRLHVERRLSMGGVVTLTPWGAFRDVVSLKVRVSSQWGDWLMREARLIRRLQPALNRAGRC
jgi:excinuclease UvrABC nuclease subunit